MMTRMLLTPFEPTRRTELRTPSMWSATRSVGWSEACGGPFGTEMTSPPIELDEAQAVVREHVAAIEHERRLPDAVVEALHRSGLHRLAIPAELGGLEAPVRTTVAAVVVIAATDGSTGWCAAIGAGSNVFAGYLPRDAARAVLPPIQTRATPRCSSYGHGRCRRPVRPPLGPLAVHQQLPAQRLGLGLGALVRPEGGPPEPAPRVVFVPLPDLEVENTWFVAGLRGTGSHHVAATTLPSTSSDPATSAIPPGPPAPSGDCRSTPC